MKRELRVTEDGSHTIYVSDLDEPYHSIRGAIQESRHVFIEQGFNRIERSRVRILEIGFGTGLNALLTYTAAAKKGSGIYYYAVEKYPLDQDEFTQINHEKQIPGCPPGIYMQMHEAPWGEEIYLTDRFSLFKEHADFSEMAPPGGFDLVYFDAFDPQKQPHLWTEEIFYKIRQLTDQGGILVTYSAKGSVRRALVSCGFHVEKVPGPPGKREMIRATRR